MVFELVLQDVGPGIFFETGGRQMFSVVTQEGKLVEYMGEIRYNL